MEGAGLTAYCSRMRRARIRRRIRFFRHFQRMCPRFFQTRELRFIQNPSGLLVRGYKVCERGARDRQDRAIRQVS